MPFGIQGPELIIILVIALLVLGPGKLPEVGSALGKSLREFRRAASDVKEATSLDAPAAPAPAAQAAPAAPVAAAPAPTVQPSDAPAAASSAGEATADSSEPRSETPAS